MNALKCMEDKMARYINLCNYSFELNLDNDRHNCFAVYTSSTKNMTSTTIKCEILDYHELLQLVEKDINIPKINCFRGGNDKYYINITRDLGIIVWSLLDKNITYISEYNNKFRESSGYLLYTILKDHLCRYIFSNKQIPIHAALLTSNDPKQQMGIIVLGESGAGKSTLCYEIYSKLDYKICADDLIVYDPISKKIYGQCNQIYLRKDMVHKYQLEDKCEKVNRKWCFSIQNPKLVAIDNFKLIYLHRDSLHQPVTANDLYNILVTNSESWCRSETELNLYKQILSLIQSAIHILESSNFYYDHILEVE